MQTHQPTNPRADARRVAAARWRALPLTLVALLAAAIGGLSAAAMALAAEPPTIESESFSNVSSGSAELHAVIDLHGLAGSYHVEYATASAPGVSTPSTVLGVSPSGVAVSVTVEGLKPESVYNFHFAAVNEDGTTTGAGASFATLALASAGLPDGRTAELVSELNPHANVYVPYANLITKEEDGVQTPLPFQASEQGAAIGYASAPTEVGGTGAAGASLGNELIAKRVSPGVWSNANILPGGYLENGGPTYQVFSPNLSLGILEAETPVAGSPLSAAAPTNTADLYARSLPQGTYSPFFTYTPTRALSTVGWFPDFGEGNRGRYPLAFAGASLGYGEMLFEANGKLNEFAVEGSEEENNLYMTDGAMEPRLINVLPNGTTQPNATFGAPWQSAGEEENTGPNFDHVISSDGARVFWTDLNSANNNLYVREGVGTGHESTTQVDSAVGGGGVFWDASSDGSKVFFTKGDLYRYDTETRETADLAPGGEVQGVLAASENGNYVYFVARGALAPGASPQTCNLARRFRQISLCNLYLYREGQPLRYISTLFAEDGTEVRPFAGAGLKEAGDWIGNLGHRTAQATPNGRELVFMHRRQFAADPTAWYEEVYLYDAEADGSLTCVSCSRSGEVPLGLGVPPSGSGDPGVAAFVPISYSLVRQGRWISEDGSRVFFDSAEPLVSRDDNGQQDVYEWESDGSGGCRAEGGCQYLLSSGTSTSSSWLLDASANGSNVFVATRGGLLPEKETGAYEAYDLTTEGATPPTPSACTGSGCQGVPSAPPVFATPASVTFAGIGNLSSAGKTVVKRKKLTKAQKRSRALAACRRSKAGGRLAKRTRVACEKRVRRVYGKGK